MRLTRVHIDTVPTPGTLVELPRDPAAHLAKVLRARSGDSLIIFCGDGNEYAGVVDSVRGSRVTVSVSTGIAVDRESPLGITLVQCVSRADRMDLIVQKATELGVTRIVPILSRRSVVRLDALRAESKAAHWRAVVVNACEQCGRNRLPIVEAPMPLIEYLGRPALTAARLRLEPGLEADIVPSAIGEAVEIAIGPEGGFAQEEVDAFRLAGFLQVRLGPRILRSETAAIAALAWLQTRFGDMQAHAGRP